MIGGEFEIDLSRKGTFVEQPDTYYYASGRAALYQILVSINDRTKCVFLPDYLCHTLVEAVEKANYQYRFYQLSDQLEAKPDAIANCGYKEGDIVLLINYFGLQDLCTSSSVSKLELDNCIIIEDDVQAYFQYADSANPYADYRYSSYRKTFPVPDGAPVYTHFPMPVVNGENTFSPYKIKAGDMKFHRELLENDEAYLSLFKKGSELIGENYDSRMSDESRALFAECELMKVKKIRQENSRYLLKELSEIGLKTILPVAEDRVPLFIPIWLENRDDVRRRMFSHNIFCPIHWPLDGMHLMKGKEMAKHELSLIIDQRYTEIEMQKIVELLIYQI